MIRCSSDDCRSQSFLAESDHNRIRWLAMPRQTIDGRYPKPLESSVQSHFPRSMASNANRSTKLRRLCGLCFECKQIQRCELCTKGGKIGKIAFLLRSVCRKHLWSKRLSDSCAWGALCDRMFGSRSVLIRSRPINPSSLGRRSEAPSRTVVPKDSFARFPQHPVWRPFRSGGIDSEETAAPC